MTALKKLREGFDCLCAITQLDSRFGGLKPDHKDDQKLLLNYLLKIDSSLEAVEDEQRWIPVEEKLPNHGEVVLAVHENHEDLTESEFIVGRLMFFLGEEVWCSNGGITIRVAGGYITHWRPLPEGPGEEAEQK